ncbi:MAG: hypothetical protein HYR56_05310 [Acidobacteria bacterium]|nr:hypothetical protein [Acidobacteriota bacterium]MBI3424531.1 hypothetical protein [Acidobacteriota bacterium]
MTNTQVFFASITVAISFIGALWAISNSTTTRLIEQFEKRMNERDEKLLAKIETLDAKMTGKFDALDARLDTLQFQITTLDKKFDGELRRELDQLNQRLNRLERAA